MSASPSGTLPAAIAPAAAALTQNDAQVICAGESPSPSCSRRTSGRAMAIGDPLQRRVHQSATLATSRIVKSTASFTLSGTFTSQPRVTQREYG